MGHKFKQLWRHLAWTMLLVEAALCLLLARLVLKTIPFRRLTWFLERSPRQPELSGSRRCLARSRVRRAIWCVAPRLPGEIVCFPKAMAAQAMLRRRKVGTELYYGAKATNGQGLKAHAWVQDGAHPVVGVLTSQGYYVLSRYPDKP